MVATAARIGFVLREYRLVEATDAAVKAKYGDLARDTLDEPIPSFFDSTADTAVMNAERLNLLKADRRRIRMETRGVQTFTGGLDYSQVTPTANVIDSERQANHNAACVDLAVDYGANRTAFGTWG